MFFVKIMKSNFMVKQKSRIKSGEIEKMTVFPISRAMLHSTPAAPGKLKPKKVFFFFSTLRTCATCLSSSSIS